VEARCTFGDLGVLAVRILDILVGSGDAPAFKLAKELTKNLKQLAPLPYSHHLQKTTVLISKLKDIQICPHHSIASLDIANLYTNIPIKDTKNIISNTLKEHKIKSNTTKELLKWFDIITQQNYFSNNNDILIQKNGLAMGAPTSGLLAEFFLQNLENAHIPTLTKKHKIAGYFRYVDDILIIYDSIHSNILDILHDFNKIHPNLIFIAEEKDQKLNFLDITIHKTPNSWDFSIHRKPTFTDTIIPYNSNHPHQCKYAATRFLYNRLHTYNIQGDHLKTETSKITNILHNNGFPTPKPHQKPKKK
jgi:hypothetical protein